MQRDKETVLFVHAHPDDESISTGGTIATLVDAGSAVTVVTCTRGELGEVVDPTLQAALESPRELAVLRQKEIASALRVLGVTDHRYLGSPGARWDGSQSREYQDSGMQWGDSGPEPLEPLDPGSLAAAELGEVAADIAAVISDIDPTAVVSYNEWGGYGHPDHIRAHAAARRAAEVMGVPFFVVEARQSAGETTIDVDVTAVFARKREALAAYRSQLVIDGESFSGANGASEVIERVESFRRLDPPLPERVDNSFAAQSVGVRIFTVIVAILLGAMAGLILTAVHQSSITIAGTKIPWAAIVGLIASGALLGGLRIVFDSRIVPAFAAAALITMTAILAAPASGGSVLVPANFAGYLWSYGVAAVTFVVLAWPNFSRRRND